MTCIFTNASNRLWVCLVKNIHRGKCPKKTEDHMNEPTNFIGGKFIGFQKNLTRNKSEEYVILWTFAKVVYLLWGSYLMHIITGRKQWLYFSCKEYWDRFPQVTYFPKYKGNQSIYLGSFFRSNTYTDQRMFSLLCLLNEWKIINRIDQNLTK